MSFIIFEGDKIKQMAVEIGAVVEGKVSGVTNFGVFVDIGDITGMVHISEVARNYVKELFGV